MVRSGGKKAMLSSWFCACALLDTNCSPLLLIALVGLFAIFIGQMRIGLHRRHDTGMPQPLLHKLPVDCFTILQVGTDEGSRMRVSQNVGMQDHSRFLGVVLEDLLPRDAQRDISKQAEK